MAASLQTVTPSVTRLSLPTPTLPPATETNTYLIERDDTFIVVEPATPYPAEQRSLFEEVRRRATQGKRFAAIVLTHHHQDHVGATKPLRMEFGVPVFAHARTREKLADKVPVDRTIDEGDTLLDGFVRALHTPGHAPGHVCLWCESEGWLIAGDMVASVGTILIDPDDDGDMDAYLRELERLDTFNARSLLPAHGDPITDPHEKLGFYVRHRLEREEKIFAALSEDGSTVSLTDIVRNAYCDTPAWLWPIAARSARAHLGRLVLRSRAHLVRDDAWARGG